MNNFWRNKWRIFQSVIGTAITDAAFCQKLVADPEGTLKANGVEATPEMISALHAIDAGTVQQLATAFTKDQAAF